MKTTSLTTKTVLATLTIALLIAGCKKECPTSSIGSLTPANIPYLHGQTVRFKTNQGDTFSTTVSRVMEVLEFDGPKCEEVLQVDLKEPDSTEQFVHFLLRGCCGGDSIVQFEISPTRNGRANVFRHEVEPDGRMQSVLLTGSSAFHDTLTIDGQLYNRVLEVLQPDWMEPKDVIELYYNSQVGLIRLKTRDGLIISRL